MKLLCFSSQLIQRQSYRQEESNTKPQCTGLPPQPLARNTLQTSWGRVRLWSGLPGPTLTDQLRQEQGPLPTHLVTS